MPTVEETIDIHAPIDRVFAEATDPRRGPEWNPNISQVSGITAPLREGSTWQQVTSVAGRPMNLTCRAVRYQPPTYGELEVSGDQRGRVWTRCQDLGGITRLTQGLEFTPPGGMLGRMIGGMAQGIMERELQQTLQRQKAALEAECGGTSGPGSGR